MNVGKDKVVTIDYTLKSDKGEVLDTSKGDEPLLYIHGHGYLVPGLEKELEGKKAGDRVVTVVSPAEGYGEYDEELIFPVPRTEFPADEELAEGMQFQAHTEEGEQIFTVKAVSADTVTVDANHPLAGQNLHFDISIVDVREATREELSHGHAHEDHCGEGGGCGHGCCGHCE